MLNLIWFGMLTAGIVCAAATGRLQQLSSAIMDGAQQGVELSIRLLGSMCLWLGFLKIAEKSGITRLLAYGFSPVIDRLFPEYREDSDIKGKMCMNFSANFLGLGNAATPLGLAAIKAMAEKNSSTSPTKGMILFVVINTASIQLLPINMAAIRSACGSTQPFGILPQIWITSAAALITCVIFCKLREAAEWNR